MKILVAPQEFKGSISALSVAEAAKVGVIRVFPKAEVVLCPVADGCDGTLETLVDGLTGLTLHAYVELQTRSEECKFAG